VKTMKPSGLLLVFAVKTGISKHSCVCVVYRKKARGNHSSGVTSGSYSSVDQDIHYPTQNHLKETARVMFAVLQPRIGLS